MMVSSVTHHNAFDSSFLLPHMHMKTQELYTLQYRGQYRLVSQDNSLSIVVAK